MAACTVRNIHVKPVLKPLNSMPLVDADITVLVIHDRQLTIFMKHSPPRKSRSDSFGQGVVQPFLQPKIHYAVGNGPADSSQHDWAQFS